MTVEQIVVKMSKSPFYIGTGAGKLAKKWGCDVSMVHDAKNIIRFGKTITKPKTLIIDIETSPMRAYVWSRWKQNIYLDQTISEWFMISWSAKWLYSGEVLGEVLTSEEIMAEDDLRITKALWQLLDDADIVIAHNGDAFDIPKINSRFIMNGLRPTTPYTQIDTKKIASKQFGFSSNKLDALAGYFGIPHKMDTDFELWSNCMRGDEKSLAYMLKYNKMDVTILEEVYLKLRPWIKGHPNVSLYNEDAVTQCCSCGSTSLNVIPDKNYYTSVGVYPLYRCKCGAISRGRKTIVDKVKSKQVLTSIGK